MRRRKIVRVLEGLSGQVRGLVFIETLDENPRYLQPCKLACKWSRNYYHAQISAHGSPLYI